jgi:hypothetical protein
VSDSELGLTRGPYAVMRRPLLETFAAAANKQTFFYGSGGEPTSHYVRIDDVYGEDGPVRAAPLTSA